MSHLDAAELKHADDSLIDDLEGEVGRLREALDDTLKALVQAQNHIRNELQPEFTKLAETGRLSWIWPSGEYDEYQAAWRLSTWWHGCGTDETIDKARRILDPIL